jgi:ribosomal protein L39E
MNELYWLALLFGLICVGVGVWWLMFPGKGGPSDSHSKRGEVHDKYAPSQTRFEATKETKASLARTGLLQQTAEEARAVTDTIAQNTEAIKAQFDQDTAPIRLQREEEALRIQHEVLEAGADLNLYLMAKAKEQNVDLPTFLELRKRLELDKLELDKQWRETEQALKGGFIYQLQAHQHLSLLTEYIGKLYDRAEQLRTQGKDRELALIEEHISFMEGDFRGRQRLLQGAEQTDVQGGDSNPQPQGSVIGTVETDTE